MEVIFIKFRVNRSNANKFIKFVHLKHDYESELAVMISYSLE